MTDTESNPLTEIWTRDENNWTIGYCITAMPGIGMVPLFYSLLICAYMSTRCQHNVMNLSRTFILEGTA